MASRQGHGMMMQPQIILLKEGTDVSQGKPQLLANITASLAVCDTIRSTLGPRGMDKLIVQRRGDVTISNDGATILKLLDVVHPAARALVDIARAQDAEVGDGTTSVVLLAGAVLRNVRPLIEDGLSPQLLIRGLRRACALALKFLEGLAVPIQIPETIGNPDESEKAVELLRKCAATAMSSKIIHSHSDFFSKMVVDAVMLLDPSDSLNESLIGLKAVAGGAVQDSFLVPGVAFKKTFSYAGFEQQPKTFKNPRVLALNVELEIKAERDNAEIRVTNVAEYQRVVDAEWRIIFAKLEAIVASGANVVLSRLPIGDLATQYFADRNIFCAGRVPTDDLSRVCSALGASVQSTVTALKPEHLGSCELMEERQIGAERYNFFTGCPGTRSATIIMRGGAEQFIAEVERSLHDAIMIVRRAIKCKRVVAGGGAIEMALSRRLRDSSRLIAGRQQHVFAAFAKALEVIPRTLCDNAGFDATEIMNRLRQKHASGPASLTDSSTKWFGVDMASESIADNFASFVWEPSTVKANCISAACEAACLILSIDDTIKNAQSAQAALPNVRGNGIRGPGGNAPTMVG